MDFLQGDKTDYKGAFASLQQIGYVCLFIFSWVFFWSILKRIHNLKYTLIILHPYFQSRDLWQLQGSVIAKIRLAHNATGLVARKKALKEEQIEQSVARELDQVREKITEKKERERFWDEMGMAKNLMNNRERSWLFDKFPEEINMGCEQWTIR